MKKTLSLLIILTMIIAMVSTGCAKSDGGESKESTASTKTTSTDKKSEGGSTSSAQELPDITFPLEESVKLTAFVTTRPNVDDFDENAFTQFMEEKTNIEFEFIVAVENQAQEKLNLLLATGDYPDIILGTQLTPTQQALYGGQGVLVPLNDMIEKYGTNTKTVFDDFEIVRDTITMKDGNIYNLPKVSDCYHCKSTQKLWIYEPWLEALNLDMPTTTEEYRDVLTAFATQDPNGNGIADEIPLAGAIKGWETQIEISLLNSFVFHSLKTAGGGDRLFIKDGQVAASYMDDGFKEGMKYLQSLRSEGLLAEESFTQAKDGLKQMGENPDAVILGSFPGGSPTVATDLSAERWRDYTVVPALEGPDGTQFSQYNPYKAVAPGFSITNACETPEIAFMMADLMYDQSIGMSSCIGLEGVTWKYIDDDSKLGINGEKAIWEEVIPVAKQDPNSEWQQLGPSYRPSWFRLGRYQEDPDNIEAVLYRETRDKQVPYYPDMDMVMPPLVLTEAQSGDLLTYSTSINEFVLEKVAEFIVSDVDIDDAWEDYIGELNNMGAQELLGIYQEAYENYNN